MRDMFVVGCEVRSPSVTGWRSNKKGADGGETGLWAVVGRKITLGPKQIKKQRRPMKWQRKKRRRLEVDGERSRCRDVQACKGWRRASPLDPLAPWLPEITWLRQVRQVQPELAWHLATGEAWRPRDRYDNDDDITTRRLPLLHHAALPRLSTLTMALRHAVGRPLGAAVRSAGCAPSVAIRTFTATALRVKDVASDASETPNMRVGLVNCAAAVLSRAHCPSSMPRAIPRAS